jgi:hypothetical protein
LILRVGGRQPFYSKPPQVFLTFLLHEGTKTINSL